MTPGISKSLPKRVAATWAFSFGLMSAGFCAASDLQVTVRDVQDKPVMDIVITATATDSPGRNLSSPSGATAIMDQVNKAFVPEVLVIRAGTTVSFPNSDSVAHQVYSFSPIKRFSLPLYRGKPYPPVVFDQPGIATLGCNIHDFMIGYVMVTETPYFGQTNAQGRWSREVPTGTYRIRAWHPRLNEQLAEQTVTVSETNTGQLTFALRKALRPLHPQTDRRIRDY